MRDVDAFTLLVFLMRFMFGPLAEKTSLWFNAILGQVPLDWRFGLEVWEFKPQFVGKVYVHTTILNHQIGVL